MYCLDFRMLSHPERFYQLKCLLRLYMDCIRQPYQTMFTLRHRSQQRDRTEPHTVHLSTYAYTQIAITVRVFSILSLRTYNLRLYVECIGYYRPDCKSDLYLTIYAYTQIASIRVLPFTAEAVDLQSTLIHRLQQQKYIIMRRLSMRIFCIEFQFLY